jgi:hypothetical protein
MRRNQMRPNHGSVLVIVAMAAVIALAAACHAQVPEMPKPVKEHELLQQFAGDWTVKADTVAAPGQEAPACEGTESAQVIGGFWLVGNSHLSTQGTSVNNLLTIGYDPETKKYVGTFVCSMGSTLWHYQGTMDATGKKLTLETEGQSCIDLSKKANYREILELKDPDHKTFTSYIQDDQGDWVKLVEMDYRRKK